MLEASWDTREHRNTGESSYTTTTTTTTTTTGKGKQREPEVNPEGENGPENCVICLESITTRCVASPCLHPYDYVCLVNWLELRQTCPLCNAPISGLLVYSSLGNIRRESVKPPSTSKDSQASSAVSGIGYLALRDRSYANPRRRRPRPPSPVSEDTALLRRRYVYQYRLRCRYVGSNRLSRFRNIGPKDFLEDEELVSRARMWMRRELMVWEWTSSNAGFLIEFIIGVLKSVDLRGSAGQAEEMVAEFLGKENAQIFIHEMHAFLRSPFTELRYFDNFVQYEKSIPRSLTPNTLDRPPSFPRFSSGPSSSTRQTLAVATNSGGTARGFRTHPYRRGRGTPDVL